MISGSTVSTTLVVTKSLFLSTVSLKSRFGIRAILTVILVYTPPNAADYGYNVYNEATGKAFFVPQAKSVPAKE